MGLRLRLRSLSIRRAHRIFGGLSYVGHRANPSEDNWIALAGPLSHIPQGLFWMILGAESVPVSALTTGPTGQTTVNSSDYAAVYNDFWLQLCSLSLLLQFILFFTNLLLPVYPLDGGRLLVNTLSHLGVGLESAAYIVSAAGLGVGGLIFGLGLLGSATQAAFGLWVLYSAFLLRQKAARGEADFDPLFAHYTGGPPGPAQGGGGGYAGAGGAPVFHPAAAGGMGGAGYGAGGMEAGLAAPPSAHYGSL